MFMLLNIDCKEVMIFHTIIWLIICLHNASSFSRFDLTEYFNNVRSRPETPGNLKSDHDIIYMPILPEREAVKDGDSIEQVDFAFHAFGEPIELKLKRNKKLLSKNFKAFIHDKNGIYEFQNKTTQRNCLYLHNDGVNVAAFSACSPNEFKGLLFYKNKTLEILPLKNQEKSNNDKQAHIIRRINQYPNINDASSFHLPEATKVRRIEKRSRHKPVGAYTLELAVFFDAAAYNIFAPYMNFDDAKLLDMIMAYINGVQALYHHPSLGTNLEIVVVRLDIMKQQPLAMPHYGGERGKLLDSFCDYQDNLNPRSDEQPEHWDMAVYLSGLDFFAYENGRKSGVTMGLATVGGVCLSKYACVIAELGTTNVFGKPYPSAGFTSVYILAHEIGHNLGMHHDSTGNICSKDGFIMSPSRGTNGETQWSTCSADVMSKLSWAKCLLDGGNLNPDYDHKKFADAPGQTYTAKKQCEILLTDVDAFMAPHQEVSTICFNLQCKTPHRSGYYYSGPALEGTECGNGMYCFGGECVKKQPPKPLQSHPGGWGPWQLGSCRSGCTYKSQGYQEKRRVCNNPTPMYTDAGCDGNGYEVALCKDDKLCLKRKRLSISDYASLKCKDFSKVLTHLDAIGVGLQAPHEENRLWMGCAIFCKRADSGSFYTPRIELNDLGISPYFPDGTLCHSNAESNYYCLQHHCLPENFQFTKLFLNQLDDDIPIPQNAHPTDDIPSDVQKYLSLDADGKPIQVSLRPGGFPGYKDPDWETNDYIDLPTDAKRLPVHEDELHVD